MGNGLYLKKGGCVCKVETDGKGLYLDSVDGSGLKLFGDGLYLKQGDQIVDGKGLKIWGMYFQLLHALAHISIAFFNTILPHSLSNANSHCYARSVPAMPT